MSETATLTRVPGALRTASMTLAAVVDSGMSPPWALARRMAHAIESDAAGE